MYPHQAERLTEALEAERLDAVVATAPANIRYVTEFESARWRSGWPEVLAVFARGGGTALVVPAVEVPGLAAEGADAGVIRCHGALPLQTPDSPAGHRARDLLDRAAPTPAGALAAALDALGVTGRIGLDASGIAAPTWRRLEAALDRYETIEGAAAFLKARAVKGPWEIECLQRALRAAEESLNAVIQMLEPGVTEREAATLWEREVVQRGARSGGAVIAMGDRSALPVTAPSERALRSGELVRFDVACTWHGYHASLGRTAVMGASNPRHDSTHGALQRALDAAVDVIRPDVTGAEVVKAAAAHAAHALHGGHGIGLEPSEPPMLGLSVGDALDAGMVLCLETSSYELGVGGLQIRDTVLVTRAGATVLNASLRGLVVLD